ncbi:MAG: hypothetical protein A3J24_02635 [Deltaproteobacteria bacterium RIFCSPLOWO2_02_FULL_53_8]|nr:MAG: hypothetical protein A3J24_02635 [Deltaproteobacteria bacterium RIFCSPLOWO2_02_FULL_53_8]
MSQDCLRELQQEVSIRAAATADFTESAFGDVVTGYLEEAGLIDGFEACNFKHRGMRIDGFYFNIEDEATLDLFIFDFRAKDTVETLTRTESEQIFKRAESFFEKALTARFVDGLEVAQPAYSLALATLEQADQIRRVRFILVTDAQLSDRLQTIPPRREAHREWVYRIWDINAICSLVTTGEPEEIDIDFANMFGTTLPCLPANQGADKVTSYLTVIPGAWLATIYDRFGGRLLEQNVRTFLQTRGKVNRGIQKTILEDPGMFFSFNNGISATASEAEVEIVKGVGQLRRVRRLQIVNGGQTTATIFNVTKRFKDASVDQISVQMKLSVINADLVDEIVPKISEYSNTQNRINDADLFASHPFHVRLEGIAGRLPAPAIGGSQIQTYWFYERARGQYVNQQAYLTKGKKSEFQIKFPRNQVITKTDLAKVMITFQRKPEIVSRGAQKNFKEFADFIGTRDAWKAKQESFNEGWYKDAVAKMIVFRTAERLVQEAPWYAQGYRANVVTYSIALIAEKLASMNRELDVNRIWAKQAIGDGLREELLRVGEKVLQRIVAAANENNVSNVTEWCKRQPCWMDLKSYVAVSISPALEGELLSKSEATQERRDERLKQRITNDIEAQVHVQKQGGAYWKRMLAWAENSAEITPTDIDILRIASQLPRKIPSGPQSLRLLRVEEKALADAFKP